MECVDRTCKFRESSDFVELDEADFYPPDDDRVYSSNVDDIDGGDCFEDYVEWFWNEYEKDIYDL